MRLLITGEKIRSCTNDDAASGRRGRIRLWLRESVCCRLGPEAPWVHRHMASCPKCQRRFVALGRVDLALRAVRSQPHRLDLLMRANACAIRMLNHRLREAAEARRLETSEPELSFVERYGRYQNTVMSVAACITVLFLTKAGLFSSFGKVRTEGQKVIRQYYASQAGEDLAGDVFKF